MEIQGRLDRSVSVLAAGMNLLVGVVDPPGGAKAPGQPIRMRRRTECSGVDVVKARPEPGDSELGPVDRPQSGRGADARPDVAHQRALDRVVERPRHHQRRRRGDGGRGRFGSVPAKGRHRRRGPDGREGAVRMEREVGVFEGSGDARDALVADEQRAQHLLQRAPRRLALREHGREAVQSRMAQRLAIAAVELAPVRRAPVGERGGVAVEAAPAPVEDGGLRGSGGAGEPGDECAELRLLAGGDDCGEIVGEEPRDPAPDGVRNLMP